MKGGVATVIIVLAIIGVAIYFLWPYLSQLFAHKPSQFTPTYKNDIITIEEVYISNTKPYAGTEVIIELYVKNNGDLKVNRVKVKPDSDGFRITKLECEGTNPRDNICVFEGENAIESLDERKIAVTLQAPSKDIIKVSPIPLSIYFYVEYDYSGYRTANIPIIDGTTRTKPMSKFSVSTPSYGPIVLSFELVPRRETKVDKTVIKEYWGVPNQPFEIKFSFEDIVKKGRQVNITKGNIRLNITEPLREAPPCDFERKDNLLLSNKDILVPEEIICYFNSSEITQPEVTASIKAEFNYTYEFSRTETITVQPWPE
jgi:hypothetical protein